MTEQMAPIVYDNAGRMKYNPDLHEMQGKPWSYEEDEYLIGWYNIIGMEEMSLALGRTEGTVANRVYHLKKLGKMPIEAPRKIERTLKSDNRIFNSCKTKKATKEPSKVSEVAMRKNSPSLYHTKGGMQVAN